MPKQSVTSIAALALPAAVLLLGVVTTGCDRVSAKSNQTTAPVAQTSPASNPSVAAVPNGFQKSTKATTKLDAKPAKVAIFFDADKWQKGESSGDGRLELTHKDGDGYALVVAERAQISLPILRKAALENAQKADPNARIVSEEKRVVNGREVMQLKMKATIEGVPIDYLGYYYTGKEGTVQVLTFTSENLTSEYQQDFEEFLNGLTIGDRAAG